MSRADTLDPVIAAELERLDAALAGEAVGEEELERLVTDLRAVRPRPSHAFRVALDERVAAGFRRPERRRLRLRGALVPALGVAATALVALVVAGVVSNDSRPARPSTGSAASSSGAVTKEALPSVGTAAPAPRSPAPAPTPGRKVERAAGLTLTPAAADVQDVADGAVRATQALGGYVEASEVSTTGASAYADMRLRVPSARLSDLIARLSSLAHVGALTQTSTDITAPTNAVADRLAEARAERSALLRALGKATTAAEISSLRERLRLNRSRIASLTGQLNALRRRAAFSTVELTITGTKHRPVAHGGGAWTPGDAARDALHVLETAAGVALVAAALLVPLGLLAAAGGLAARAFRRRQREAALDAG